VKAVTPILDADKILVLKDGRLVETGTHAELIQRGGVYHALFQKQFAGIQAGN
jgi:ABC-type transport system involved in Fe-S cluster assembly fused permease/ATPase subunit